MVTPYTKDTTANRSRTEQRAGEKNSSSGPIPIHTGKTHTGTIFMMPKNDAALGNAMPWHRQKQGEKESLEKGERKYIAHKAVDQ